MPAREMEWAVGWAPRLTSPAGRPAARCGFVVARSRAGGGDLAGVGHPVVVEGCRRLAGKEQQLVWSAGPAAADRTVVSSSRLGRRGRPRRCGRCGRCAGDAPDALVLTAPAGGVLYLRNWRRRVFDPAGAAAGLAPSCLMSYVIRRRAWPSRPEPASRVCNGCFGHASAAMTLDAYAACWIAPRCRR